MWTWERARALQKLLDDASINHEEAAEHADVDRTTISRWVHDRQSPLKPQSKKGGLVKLGRALGFPDLESLLAALDFEASQTVDASGLGAAGRQVLQQVLVRGLVSQDSLISPLVADADTGVSECLAAEVVVTREIDGERFYCDPALALLSEVAREPLSKRQLEDKLGLRSGTIDELTTRRGRDLRIGPGDTVTLASHRYAVTVFDWGDTLVDERAYDDAICEQLAKKCPRDRFLELLSVLEENKDARWYDYFFLAEQLDIAASEVEDAHNIHRDKLEWITSAKDALRRAGADGDVVLATNCHSRVLQLRMDLLGLPKEIFSKVVTSDDCESLDTKKEMYDKVLQHYGVAASDVLVVSDSYDWDVLPALALGCHAIWFHRGPRYSLWGTPAYRLSADSFHLMRNSLKGGQLPDLVALDHAETVAWLSGS